MKCFFCHQQIFKCLCCLKLYLYMSLIDIFLLFRCRVSGQCLWSRVVLSGQWFGQWHGWKYAKPVLEKIILIDLTFWLNIYIFRWNMKLDMILFEVITWDYVDNAFFNVMLSWLVINDRNTKCYVTELTGSIEKFQASCLVNVSYHHCSSKILKIWMKN